ncbi:hypothetical protein AVEN_242524-1 [Araneus ventricosus]|uniref:DUF4817 domain-containing protein n=1 Tax=Araneus ventricosus TaxID=182803 RepID=A0A4Y2P292_ARAVE|nr:hypothetical protein AVEN_242524-1 [Araneus ventricosus]
MASSQEQAQVAARFIEFKSATQLNPDDKPRRRTFAEEMLQKMEDDENFLQRVMFSDEVTFHISGPVNRRIWGLENSRAILAQARDSSKVNV